LDAEKYPCSLSGNLIFEVSGEKGVQQGTKASPLQVIRNLVKIEFVPGVFAYLDTFDTRFTHGLLDTRLEATKKQDIGNSMVATVIFSIILLVITVGVFIVVLPFMV